MAKSGYFAALALRVMLRGGPGTRPSLTGHLTPIDTGDKFPGRLDVQPPVPARPDAIAPFEENGYVDIELMPIPGCPYSAAFPDPFACALALEGIDPNLMTVLEITADADAAARSFPGITNVHCRREGPVCLQHRAGRDLPGVPGEGRLSGQPLRESLRQAVQACV